MEASIIAVFSKLLVSAIDMWTNDADWKHDGKTLKLIERAIETGGHLVNRRNSGNNNCTGELNARYTTLIIASFGEAFRHHWVHNEVLAPWERGPRWWEKLCNSKEVGEKARRREEIEFRLDFAINHLLPTLCAKEQDNGDTPTLPVGGVNPPIHSLLYRALWDSFTDPGLASRTREDIPLIKKDADGKTQLQFEFDFADAWRCGLASAEGIELRNYLVDIRKDARGEQVRSWLRDQTVSWRRQHVFRNLQAGGEFPAMPLEDVYIEPSATAETGNSDTTPPSPAIKLINQLLQEYPVVFVAADMGHGKSLTARMLAWQHALQHQRTGSLFSKKSYYPVYVRCAIDLNSNTPNIAHVIARSMRRQAQESGLHLPTDDPSFCLPAHNRVLLLLDGLDEVNFTERELRHLIDSIEDWTSNSRRCIVFSRPAVLPNQQKIRVPVVTIQKFSETQIESWLNRWNWVVRGQSSNWITKSKLKRRRIFSISNVPIILLMIAFSWEKLALESEDKVDRALIYDLFFREIARGKFEQGGEDHPEIQRSAAVVRQKLVAARLISKDATEIEAMLWLMGRVAWERKILDFRAGREGRPPIFRRSQIESQILAGELMCEDSVVLHCIQIGLLLAIQADLRNSANSNMLFGHRSFVEYLVARHWLHSLKLITTTRNQKLRAKIERQLMKGPLRKSSDDESYTFLKQMLAREPRKTRAKIGRWAICYFGDDQIFPSDEGDFEYSIYRDNRTRLRVAALAIASCTGKVPKIEPRWVFRSLLAWVAVRDGYAQVVAPGVVLDNDCLAGADLRDAVLSNASLRGCDLSGARLNNAVLSNASLVGAKLLGAMLYKSWLPGANLKGAAAFGAIALGSNLSKANLETANFQGAMLSGVVLRGANLKKTSFSRAALNEAVLDESSLVKANLRNSSLRGASLKNSDLRDAKLQLADLYGANLQGANLQDANLQGANLQGANLQGANLQDANLQDANLQGANLQDANLQDANLQDANLQDANLQDANLQDANLSRQSQHSGTGIV